MEANETPRGACLREIKEEMGISGQIDRLLCVDHALGYDDRPEGLFFVFLGTPLSQTDLSQVNLMPNEISSFEFVELRTALERLVPRAVARIKAALAAIGQGGVVYTEEGINPFESEG